jgi:hypothetical protein
MMLEKPRDFNFSSGSKRLQDQLGLALATRSPLRREERAKGGEETTITISLLVRRPYTRHHESSALARHPDSSKGLIGLHHHSTFA